MCVWWKFTTHCLLSVHATPPEQLCHAEIWTYFRVEALHYRSYRIVIMAVTSIRMGRATADFAIQFLRISYLASLLTLVDEIQFLVDSDPPKKKQALSMKMDVHLSYCRDLQHKYTKSDAKLRRKQKNVGLYYKSVAKISSLIHTLYGCTVGGKAHYIHWYSSWLSSKDSRISNLLTPKRMRYVLLHLFSFC